MKGRKCILKSIILVMIFFLGLFVPVISFANDESVKVTDEMVLSMAEKFVEGILPDDNLTAVEPVKFYNEEGQAIGYIVSYEKENIPYGYVIFDSTYEDLICEYRIDEGVISPCEVANLKSQKLNQSRKTNSEINSKVYKYDALTYGVIDENENVAITNYGENIPVNNENITFASATDVGTSTWNDVFFDIADIYEDYSMVDANNVEIYTMEESFIEEETDHYACLVTALAICADYYGALDYSNFSEDYLDLWDLSDTSTSSTSNGIIYGATPIQTAGAALVDFCEAKNVYITSQYLTNPSINSFRTCIRRGDVGIIHLGINRQESTGIEESRHSMAVEGYAIIRKNNTTSNVNTVLVADGWYAEPRYLNFDFDDYTVKRAHVFN